MSHNNQEKEHLVPQEDILTISLLLRLGNKQDSKRVLNLARKQRFVHRACN